MLDDKVCHPAALFHTNLVDFFTTKKSASSIKCFELYVCAFFERFCSGYFLGQAIFQPEH